MGGTTYLIVRVDEAMLVSFDIAVGERRYLTLGRQVHVLCRLIVKYADKLLCSRAQAIAEEH